MPNYNDLINSIKNIVKDYMNVVDLSTFCFGQVIKVTPLEIMVEQKFSIDRENLVIPRTLTDYEVEIEIEKPWETEDVEYKHKHQVSAAEATADTTEDTWKHKHIIKGKKKIKVLNGLKNGDKVVLLKQMGGQKYLVIDRV